MRGSRTVVGSYGFVCSYSIPYCRQSGSLSSWISVLVLKQYDRKMTFNEHSINWTTLFSLPHSSCTVVVIFHGRCSSQQSCWTYCSCFTQTAQYVHSTSTTSGHTKETTQSWELSQDSRSLHDLAQAIGMPAYCYARRLLAGTRPARCLHVARAFSALRTDVNTIRTSSRYFTRVVTEPKMCQLIKLQQLYLPHQPPDEFDDQG